MLALLFVALLFAVAYFTDAIAPKDLATWTFPFVGTLLGAVLAFKYQGINESVRREELRAGAINRAILVLVSQAHYLSTVQAELSKGKDSWHQISNLRAFPNPPSSHDYFWDINRDAALDILTPITGVNEIGSLGDSWEFLLGMIDTDIKEDGPSSMLIHGTRSSCRRRAARH